jgi:hypothetical protein
LPSGLIRAAVPADVSVSLQIQIPIAIHFDVRPSFFTIRGLRVLDEVGRRVQTAWGNRAHWVTCFELADQMATGQKSISDERRPAHRQ